MGREIKFRAWDERKKVMHFEFEFIRSGEDGNDWIVFKSDKQSLREKPHPFDNPYFQQQLKIMQFTGLRDKNGKEIWEGDVLSVTSVKDPVIVKWGEGSGACCPADLEAGFKVEDGLYGMEVIGNIHENPELVPK